MPRKIPKSNVKDENRESLPLIVGEDSEVPKYEFEIYVRRDMTQMMKVRVLSNHEMNAESLAKGYAFDHKDKFSTSTYSEGYESCVIKARQLTSKEVKQLQQKIKKK